MQAVAQAIKIILTHNDYEIESLPKFIIDAAMVVLALRPLRRRHGGVRHTATMGRQAATTAEITDRWHGPVSTWITLLSLWWRVQRRGATVPTMDRRSGEKLQKHIFDFLGVLGDFLT